MESALAHQAPDQRSVFGLAIKRVFVYEGYIPRGGTYMAYSIGRVCHEKFGVPVYIVGQNRDASSFFAYDYHFPALSKELFEREVRSDDLFICNPSFSDNLFGLRIPARKLMYVQDIKTFRILDTFFDHYVSVSSFVQDFIERYYKIHTPVIPAFINLDVFSRGLPWDERKDRLLVLNFKEGTMQLLEHLAVKYNERYPYSQIDVDVINPLPQQELAELMGQYKYYLSLSAVEGFGLPSLEAMASGCAVFGFDAMGGRDYFREGNSFVVPYGSLDRLIDKIFLIEMRSPKLFEAAMAGMQDAQRFSRDHFDNRWFDYLSKHVFA
jgi:hypothetical protein